MRKANGQVFQTETTSSAKKLLSPISQNGRLVGEAELVVQDVVDQAVVALEHERPGDDGRVDGQRVRGEEERPAAGRGRGRSSCMQDRRGGAEQPGQADRQHGEDDR